MTRESLLEQERALVKLAQHLKKTFVLFRGRKEKKLKKLQKARFYAIDTYLIIHEEAYAILAKANQNLLETPQISFSVETSHGIGVATHTHRLKGNIHKNGLSYLKRAQEGYEMVALPGSLFPSELSGTVDHWGNLDLYASAKKRGWLKTLPRSFVGSIDAMGKVHLINTGNDYELFSDKEMMERLIGNHFVKNKAKGQQFETNKKAMKQHIQRTLKELRSEL